MATGETKLSYLDVVDDIQDGDTVPILRDGKNYMSKGLAQLNADLTDKFQSLNNVDISDITKSGLYYVRTSCTGFPTSTGGFYALTYYSASYQVGLFIPRASAGAPYVLINGSVAYQLPTTAVTNLRLEPAEGTDED